MSMDELDDANIREEYERMRDEQKKVYVPFPKKRDENNAIIRKWVK